MVNGTDDVDRELEALRQVAIALSQLDGEAVARVLRWTADRFATRGVLPEGSERDGRGVASDGGNSSDSGIPEDIAELFERTNPATDPDKALVVGYWLQYVKGDAEFEAFAVNKQLKHLGHRVSNITKALSALIERRPQFVIQTRKEGTSKQARKKYKLTTAGKAAVEGMLKGEPSNGS